MAVLGGWEDMMDTPHHTEKGAALAANQIGILRRLVVDYCDGQLKQVNPEIIQQSGVQECIEGCLSFPNLTVKTKRPQKVTVEALDENGPRAIVTGEGELAKCLCHGLEHLDGIVFPDPAIEEGFLEGA